MARKKKSRRIRLLNKFIRIFFASFVIFILIAGIGTFGAVQMAKKNILGRLNTITGEDVTNEEGLDDVLSHDEASYLNDKKLTTVAVFGVDKDGYRTDVTMLVFFHHKTGFLDVVSIPRDTVVKIPDDIYKDIHEARPDVKQSTRINAIPAYVNAKNRNDVSVKVLEQVFDVDIDYYVNMDLAGFKEIVDAVGPIYMDVPRDMKYTDVPGELVINLDAGPQEINGAKAEGLIRFRKGYGNQDIGRIETQHIFMKAFMKQLLEPETKMNLLSLAQTFMTKVTTNFNDAVDYLVYINDLSVDKVNFVTLPGGDGNGGTYAYDVDETKTLFEEILNRPDNEDTSEMPGTEGTIDDAVSGEGTGTINDADKSKDSSTEEVNPVEMMDAKTLTISVQNGTNTGRLAASWQDKLKGLGYNVTDASNYENKPLNRTIITAPAREVAEELGEYFNDPTIRVDENLEEAEFQVIIAIGNTDTEIN